MKNVIHIGLFFIIFIIVYPQIFDSKLDMGGDNYHYLNYSEAISNGHGYSSPYSPDYPPTGWYPPGYSCFLTLVHQNVQAAKIANGIMLLLIAVAVYFILRQSVLGFVAGAFILLNPGLLRLSTVIYSEMLFTLLSVSTILVLVYYPKKLWLLILLSAGAIYVRSVGYALIGAMFLYLFIRNWQSSLKYLGGVIALYLPWMIRNHVQGINGRYFSLAMQSNPWRPEEGTLNITEFINRTFQNFNETTLTGFPEALLSIQSLLLGILVLVIIIYGAWRLKEKWFFLFYLVFNIGIICIFHGGNGIRYVWPMVPVLYLCLFFGLWGLITRRRAINQNYGYVLLLLILFLIPGIKERAEFAKSEYPPNYQSYITLAKEVGKLNNDFTVVCRKPEIFHYYSRGYTNNYKYTLDNQELLENLIEKKVDFVVLDNLGYSSTYRYLYPAIQNNKEKFQVVYADQPNNTYLLLFNY